MKSRVIILILFALSGSFFLQAQTSLPNSERNSSKFYIYKANAENLRQIYLKDKNPDENMLQSFVISYDRGDEIPPLPNGNYFIVGADANQLVFREHTVDDFDFRIYYEPIM